MEKDNIPSTQIDGFTLRRRNVPIGPHPESDVYARHKNRGIALIFNHKNFTMNCETREGTDKDRDDMESVLEEIGFTVLVHNNLTYLNILHELHRVSKLDHTDCDSLILVVMTHGDRGCLYAKDTSYPTQTLWKYFTPERCPSLVGKPKLFFLQACRGTLTDPGTELRYLKVETDGSSEVYGYYTLPITADYLVMYSTVEGHIAWRDAVHGSFFIQALVRLLREFYRTEDLLYILTKVNKDVAIGFTSHSPTSPQFHRQKEMSSIVSTLTRLFYLG